MSPFAPHISEELYSKLTGNETIAYAQWPSYDEGQLVLDEIELVVQVNGKLRGKVNVALDEDDAIVEAKALEVENVTRHLEGLTVRKVIVVKNRLVNIVAN